MYIGPRVDKHVQNNVVLQYENIELGVCHVRILDKYELQVLLSEAVAKRMCFKYLIKLTAIIKAIP